MAQRQRSLVVKKDSWYGNLLFLGEKHNAPIFTFTNEDFLSNEINSPDQHYLRTIMMGLSRMGNLSDNEIINYLKSKKGILGSALQKQLIKILKEID